jgi:3',5'-cyclic-AMP phosphodiesterase
MIRIILFIVLSLAITLGGCQGNPGKNADILLRIAFLGDAEPKPLAEFPNMAAAIEQINTLAQTQHIDFVIGVGDIAHKGTEVQYDAATLVLQKLSLPFYPIMGNEEHGSYGGAVSSLRPKVE